MTTRVLFSTQAVSNSGNLGVITLNSPESLNALKHEMVLAIDEQLARWSSDDSIKAIVIQAAGEKAFCAGGDIRDLYHLLDSEPDAVNQFISTEYSLDYTLFTYSKPTICLSTRLTMGAGMGLMQACDYRIISPRTIMAMPEVKIGIFPDVGATYFYGNLPDRLGLYLGLTSAVLSAPDAIYTKLATHCIAETPDAEILSAISTYNWDNYSDESLDAFLCEKTSPSDLPSTIEQLEEHIATLTKGDSLEEVYTAIMNDSQEHPWLQQNRENLDYGSPTSRELTFIQLTKGQGLSRKEAKDLEITMMTTLINKQEFHEGVRALLIDKDKAPQWSKTDTTACKKLLELLTR